MAITIANTSSQVGNGVTSITISPGISTTTGNWIVIATASYGPTGGFTSITSANGTTGAWANATAEVVSGGTACKCRLSYAQVTSGNANHTFTYNCSGTDYPSMAVWELSGLGDATPLGETTTDNTQYQSPYSVGLSIPDTDERLLLAFGGTNAANAETVTQTGSFVQDKNIGVSGSNEMLLASHLASTTSGTKTFSFTTSPGPTEWYAIGIRAFKVGIPAPAPGTSTPNIGAADFGFF